VDSHVHPVFGDWTPRQNQIGWVESFLNGGVTTMISAGEVHLPGRPKDIVGLKALAVTAQRAFFNARPAGVKVLAGAPVLEHGMVESDFAELAAAGVTLLGEVGLGSVKSGYEAREMVAWARKYGIQSTIHTGGPSIPGSGLIDKDTVLEADADIIGHINGGHTSLPEAHVCELCERSSRAIELVHNGNERVAIAAVQAARDLGQLHRVILGTDSPAGSGVQPLGILRMISLLSSLGGIPAAQAIAFATGNTARIRNLDAGLIEVGRAADLVFLDRAQHTAGRDLLHSIELGDIPGIGAVMIDGVLRCGRSRNTPPAERVPEMLRH
jgi:enamidase